MPEVQMWLCAVWYTTTLLDFGHCILYPNYGFATLSRTQELEWKKMRTWPCTGSGEVQKPPQFLPWKSLSPGEKLPWRGGRKKSCQCFWGRAVLSCPALAGGRCMGRQLPSSCCGSDASLHFPHLLLLFFKSVGGK